MFETMRILALTIAAFAPLSLGNATCSMEITGPHADPHVGEHISVELILRNTSDHPISPRGPNSNGVDTLYRYECRDGSGSSVRRAETGILDSVGDVQVLAPGEDAKIQLSITAACNLEKPGRYTVQLSRKFSYGKEDEIVRSNMLSITVLP
ncbi:MAG TPA: hypothetical protein VGN16_04800 [Acidobacteriaceae bacterium]|jgi:hypothetical protein